MVFGCRIRNSGQSFEKMKTIDLSSYGITSKTVLRNASPPALYMESIRFEPDASISDEGALIAYSGEKTGRSPKDKRIVRHPDSENDIWWGDINVEIDSHTFEINRQRALDYLNVCPHLYVVDAFAGWDPDTQIKIRVICSRPYHALFMHTMLIRPTDEQLENFGEPDFIIYNAGKFPANRHTEGMSSKTSIDLSFEDNEMVILGTEYAGEMKKGVFTLMQYLMPKQGHLSMHCSATADPDSDRSAVLFGLSGTGKTTLSADPKRMLIGDDEHVWSDKGIFNIEGGCYAKAIDLTLESEPDIFNALHFGAVLENVVYDENHHVDFTDTSITENTRGAYPINFIKNAQLPCIAGHPTDIIFLTCDAFGVLPPVARLSEKQAMYHFISGYTAKVAGTEMGITEPTATFSACFGAPFLVMHPSRYAELLAEKLQKHNVNVWLVNTGWTGGGNGVGSRIKLRYSRAIVDAIYQGNLTEAPTFTDPTFGFETVTECPGVPSETLQPRNAWADKNAYDESAKKLASLFIQNFEKYAASSPAEIKDGGPAI